MASVAQIHAAATNLASSIVKSEVGKARPSSLRQVRQKTKPSPLTQLKSLVLANAMLKAQGPQGVPQVNPFQAAPTQTPPGLLALISQKGAKPSPNGMV